ncbi:cytochrome P450 [Nonomuraea turkmeniaca]|uniref:Cytochrome P450 n=1 Tax=Nonomuraea turkmeniaca TaxID=103838 RepID=A0A5S4FNH8_9ACTN|nr:cytochrome P450 [Nonomuraea turkmeniaca]TMR22307.1 cytochrome P450 [Nonomuraea turkmeniaca]
MSLLTQRQAGCPFDPAPELARLRAEEPVSPLTYPDGHEGWLVTSHALAREVLSDPRFSHKAELLHNPLTGVGISDKPQPAPPGAFTAMDPPEHTRYRQLLTGQFTVRRMRRLTERIKAVTAERLDAMQEEGPPVDLVQAFAVPIPGQVMCELLGVPESDRSRFYDEMAVLGRMDVSPEDKAATFMSLRGYVAELIQDKRANPTDDMLSGLAGSSDLTDDELATIGFILVGAGLDTTANMISLGAYALMGHRDQIPALRRRGAAEELLRYLSIIPASVRAALEDLELGGVQIKAGQSVTVSIPAANRDPQHFAEPDTLDLHRSASGHVAFGHGIHQCLGQQLARVEMEVALPALFDRFPTLRLAVPEEEVPLRDDMLIYGLYGLPVTWDPTS